MPFKRVDRYDIIVLISGRVEVKKGIFQRKRSAWPCAQGELVMYLHLAQGDEDEGSLPRGRVYRATSRIPTCLAGKIERSAEALQVRKQTANLIFTENNTKE